MEDTDAKICPNCKKEIPTVNFTIHEVHCARNIRVCPVCKEPVPQADLQDHHDKLHKLLPCKKCGERVCGTDLEDHVRDSCAHTIKSCRYCELELPRRELPLHEGYCGVRTEQCPDCKEWVMIKYRQLHLDSNHGFLRLDDDPVPTPRNQGAIRPLVAKITNLPSTSNGLTRPLTKVDNNSITNGRKIDNIITASTSSEQGPSSAGLAGLSSSSSAYRPSSVQTNGVKVPVKRTNDQPQINTNTTSPNKVEKNLSISRGAVKKRPAPKPPSRQPPPEAHRDEPYYSALRRQQAEEAQRQEQTAYNLSVGLPPVLSPAAKLEKLRKLDALQNPPEPPLDYQNRLQGRIWTNPDYSGNVLGSQDGQNRRDGPNDNQMARDEFKNVKPMSPQEFMERFNRLQLMRDAEEQTRIGDRFSEIKSSLRELRRGLNEVTAPYNLNANSGPANVDGPRRNSNRVSPVGFEEEEEVGDIRLPCEFCTELLPPHDLVQHQTGCRPDLAQFRPVVEEERELPATGYTRDNHEPVIPCEFCTESLPVYLISEHQERCGRETNLLYPD